MAEGGVQQLKIARGNFAQQYIYTYAYIFSNRQSADDPGKVVVARLALSPRRLGGITVTFVARTPLYIGVV